jgi:hypothetical protein
MYLQTDIAVDCLCLFVLIVYVFTPFIIMALCIEMMVAFSTELELSTPAGL